jgi:hypothetical protein
MIFYLGSLREQHSDPHAKTMLREALPTSPIRVGLRTPSSLLVAVKLSLKQSCRAGVRVLRGEGALPASMYSHAPQPMRRQCCASASYQLLFGGLSVRHLSQ